MTGIEHEETEKIVVLGIGINGCEAVNRMIERKTEGVDFAIAAEDGFMHGREKIFSEHDSELQKIL